MNILVIAPHPDDETLGVGGTIRRAADAGHRIVVVTVAAHMPPMYSAESYEATMTEARAAHAVLGVDEHVFLEHAAMSLRDLGPGVLNGMVAEQIERFRPDAVFIPFPDRHVDHREVFEACMVAMRPVGVGSALKCVAAYETISSTHWNAPGMEAAFTPNLVVDITSQIDGKIEAMGCYKSQLQQFPAARSLEALRALALFRGSQAGYGYGEAFHIIRMGAELFL